jgi:hypothetical protein
MALDGMQDRVWWYVTFLPSNFCHSLPCQLIVCAIGAISAPFEANSSEGHSHCSRDPETDELAEACFAASQKRLGPLLCRGGIIEAQCLFFSGVYLMHCFRPFAAWQLFLQALACCQSFPCNSNKQESPLSGNIFEAEESGWRSEEGMYWTCFKTEL